MKIQNAPTDLNVYLASAVRLEATEAKQPAQQLMEAIQQLSLTQETAGSDLENLFRPGGAALTSVTDFLESLACQTDSNQTHLNFDWAEHRQAQEDPAYHKTSLNMPGDSRDWIEVQTPQGKSYAFTEETDIPDDGKGPWTEIKANGRTYKTREYDEDGIHWVEYIDGDNRYRYVNGGAKGIAEEARGQGCHTLNIEGQSINIFGKVEDWELNVLQQAMSEMPAPARALLKELFVAPRLGEVMRPDGSEQQVAGMGGPGMVILQKACLASPKSVKEILFHEAGHGFDQSHQPPLSSRPPWGDHHSVSSYGGRSAAEDFAEVHAAVLLKWDDLSRLDAAGWAKETCWEKKHEIFTAYGGKAPSVEEIRAAGSYSSR